MNIINIIDDYKRFWEEKKVNIKLVTWFPDGFEGVDFRDFDFTKESEHICYWDNRIENTYKRIEQRKDVEDDLVPGLTLNYGFGSFGGIYCDEPLIFTEDTSYLTHEVMKDLKDADKFLYSKERFWSQIFINAAEYISKIAGNDFMLEVYPSPSPLDVINLLRGSELFTDFYEHSDELKSLLKKTSDGIIEHTKNIRSVIHSKFDGVFTFDKYIPRGILLLEDAADLCSPQIYEEFGKPYTEKVIAAFGGGYIHHHSLGRQQFYNIDRLDGLTVHQISSDPTCIKPITDMDYLTGQISGDVVLDLECTFQDFIKYYEKLNGGRYIVTMICKDKEEAKRAVDFVREKFN